MSKVKLTKKAISDFLVWGSSRYNEWKKKDLVAYIYKMMLVSSGKMEATYGCWTDDTKRRNTKNGGATYHINFFKMTIQNQIGEVLSFQTPIDKIIVLEKSDYSIFVDCLGNYTGRSTYKEKEPEAQEPQYSERSTEWLQNRLKEVEGKSGIMSGLEKIIINEELQKRGVLTPF